MKVPPSVISTSKRKKHRVTIPCKWSFIADFMKSGEFHVKSGRFHEIHRISLKSLDIAFPLYSIKRKSFSWIIWFIRFPGGFHEICWILWNLPDLMKSATKSARSHEIHQISHEICRISLNSRIFMSFCTMIKYRSFV